MTRSDYLEVSHTEQSAAHRRYYRQFVTPYAMQQASLILTRHKDAPLGPDQFPQIPLGAWYGHQRKHPEQVYHALGLAGDYMTTVTSVCILKEAAHQLHDLQQEAARQLLEIQQEEAHQPLEQSTLQYYSGYWLMGYDPTPGCWHGRIFTAEDGTEWTLAEEEERPADGTGVHHLIPAPAAPAAPETTAQPGLV